MQKEGFGALKNKLNVDFCNYRRLGACNPPFAYRALQAEDKIGAMPPRNVILQEKMPGQVAAPAVNPLAFMAAVDNPPLAEVAKQAQAKLKKVAASL